MAVQYWVGDFFVDLSRNQVTQKEQSQTIAPKALAVLTYLAENQGRVVSYDELLTKVWPNTVVTPNTLQRSIAQLRKVLDQDCNIQSYIKTHAKQGYSLECDVKWHNETVDRIDTIISTKLDLETVNSPIENELSNKKIQTETEASNSIQSHKSLYNLIIIIVILAIIGFNVLTPSQPLTISFGELRPLTATDNKEHSAIYSPNGEYIVFNRYSEDVCVNSNIWAKNIKTQKETQLTQTLGSYSNHSFSKDGKKLVFIESSDCKKPVTQKECYKLMILDFEKALAVPQSPSPLMECKNSRITKATWLNNNNVALLQEFDNRWKLISYSIADNKSTVIYELEEGNFFDYDYSVIDDIIALTNINNNNQHFIEILKPDGQVLSRHEIDYPKEIPNFRNIYPNFTPKNKLLIFSTGRQLFTLSFDGKITNISLPLDEPIGSPIFHPNGKRALVIKGNWDSDILMMSLSQKTKSKNAELQLTQAQQGQILTTANSNDSMSVSSALIPTTPVQKILERSTLAENNAIYQPNGDLIAFQSARFGNRQVWISDGNSVKQLSSFPTDSYISGMSWASDGQSVLVNVNNILTQVALDSSHKTFTFAHGFAHLFQWDSEENTVLLTARIKGTLTFGEFNLMTSEFKAITNKKVNWALKSEDGRLIYTDSMDRFWQPGPAEDQLIEALDGQGSDKRFIIKNNIIYGVNDEMQLWSYHLNGNTFEVIGNIPKNIDYLTDINQSDILLTIRISAKKEVAELTLNE